MAIARYLHRRYGVTSRISVSLCLILGVLLYIQEVACPQEVIVVRSEIPNVVARWNAAVRHCRKGDWGAVIEMVPPQERAVLETESGHRLLALDLVSEINDEQVIVYQEKDGLLFARIYGERQMEEKVEGKPVRLHYRTLLGSMTRQRNGPWLIDFAARDVHPFGLGKSIGGMRLSVMPREQVIESWKEFQVKLVLENTNTKDSVSIQAHPSFYLDRNLVFVLVKAEPVHQEKVFREWYNELENMSPPIISGLLESMRSSHKPSILRPGDRQEYRVNLRTLCWKGDAVPEGPTGAFDLFAVYDANLEWDPVEASMPVWRHRIASGTFRVVVK